MVNVCDMSIAEGEGERIDIKCIKKRTRALKKLQR